MKFKDLKIATQLKMGLSVVLILVLLLGTLSLIQTGKLWEETKGLYEHPLTVRRAVGEIKADLIYIHRDMKDILLTDNEQERQLFLQDIDTWEADAHRQFDIVFDRYLGPKNDIEEAYNAFIKWKSIREETIRILRVGETKEAINRTKSSGICGGHLANLLGEVKQISDFAKNRGDQFYQNAAKQHNYLKLQLIFVVVAILLLTAGIAYFMSMRIREPLDELISATKKFYKGNLDARSNYISSNEFGILSASFNEMADTILLRLETEKKSTIIAKTLIVANDTKEFAQTVLEKLMEITESNMGVFYILSRDNITFSPLSSIGVNPELLEQFDGSIFEGEFGQSLKTGKISHIRNIPEDTIFKFKTFVGTAIPKEIITLPILVNEDVRAMVSLASISGYSNVSLTILSQPSLIALNTAFGNLIANDKTRLLAKELKQTNEELESQKEELWEQTIELKAQTEEVLKQSEELQEQNIELEQQRLAVEDANRLKSQFLSNMSHELRTPLNSVMALSRVLMMQAKQKLNDDEVSYLEIIERNGKNLLNLINDILDLSKIESGRMDINPHFFSIELTIENIVERLTPIAEEKKIKIRQNISENLPKIESDEIRVTQILQNLIANAVKFTAVGGVNISVKNDEKKILVSIEDTGIGIAENDLPSIFDEFRQVDGSSSRRHEGTGLGLAIARKAALMLGGKIGVTSKLGEGSIFTLTLPIAWQGAATTHEPFAARKPNNVKSTRKTILVVDDDPAMASMISQHLLHEGYNTITATSGAEALKLAEREHPFAITLDIVMPEMDGWEVLQGLKKNPETKDIPVIIVSVSPDKETGFALGAIGYATKPVSKNSLLTEIRKIGKSDTRSIMIVDDNVFDRQEIKKIIAEDGLLPIVAEDGNSCLKLIKQQIPDLLILDLMMPELDGFAVLEKIRTNPETKNLPVIVVTAKDLTEEERKILSGNVFSVLEKNAAKPSTLLPEIKRILCEMESPSKKRHYKKLNNLPRILLVEDNEVSIIQVRSVLESAGYFVDVAHGGQDAFEYVSHTIPDGIILDLMMPEVDGFAVLEKIRGKSDTAEIPVLILTAKDLTPEDLKRLSANHVQQLVQKGDVDRENLLMKVRLMVDNICKDDISKSNDLPKDDFTKDNILKDHLSKDGIVKENIPVTSAEISVELHPMRNEESQPETKIIETVIKPSTILIVEDNPDNMVTIKAILQNRYPILEARDGQEGLKIATKSRSEIKLILLDMAMPKMDGMAVIKHLKNNPKLSHIPTVALTAKVMKGEREQILEAGCNDYISKPIEPESFLKKITQLMEK